MDALLAVGSFAFVTSITPGPNNLMLAASGIGFGMRRTLPHLFGVSAGFLLLLLACSAGIGALVTELPGVATVLKATGSAYLLYLAWRLRTIGTGGYGSGSGSAARPMSFTGAALFQFANPKAWVMGLTAAALFLPDLGSDWRAVALLCLVMSAVNLPCVSSWALLGAAIRNRLANPRWQRTFSTGIVALTVYTAVSLWL
ncbi:MAG: LysE family translocator [Pseudomonadales bacterium]